MSDTASKKRVLVVDDHAKVLKFIEIDLKLRGFEVFCAGSGEKALELVRSEGPDIVLLDMVMPGKDGFEVLQGAAGFFQDTCYRFQRQSRQPGPGFNCRGE